MSDSENEDDDLPEVENFVAESFRFSLDSFLFFPSNIAYFKDPDSRSTSVLVREAAASAGIKKRTRMVEETEQHGRGKVARKASGGANY